MTERMTKGVLQPNGTTVAEPRMDVCAVANAIVYMDSLPLDGQRVIKRESSRPCRKDKIMSAGSRIGPRPNRCRRLAVQKII